MVVPTRDGSLTLSHGDHGELYHSEDGAAREANDLYIEGSGILRVLSDPLASNQSLKQCLTSVLDVGLGLGYNALASYQAWLETGAHSILRLVSLEIDPDLVAELASGNAPWQVGWSDVWLNAVQRLTPNGNRTVWRANVTSPAGGEFNWTIVVGDALSAGDGASAWQGAGVLRPDESSGFQYIWQDPFSPEKNPDMWTPEWFRRLGQVVQPEAILMTYSVARPVREALQTSGWRVEKIATTTRKKNWLRASFGGIPPCAGR